MQAALPLQKRLLLSPIGLLKNAVIVYKDEVDSKC
jgi:hypothetical protein